MQANSTRCTRDTAGVSAQKGWLPNPAHLGKWESSLECDFLGSAGLTVGLNDLGGLFQEKIFHGSALQCVALDKSWSSKVCLQQTAASGDVMNYLRVRMHIEKNPFFASEQKGCPKLFPCLCPSPNAVGADTVP